MTIRKIKVKHGNTEIELEAEEDFLIKFLNSKELFKSEPSNAKTKKSGKKKAIGSKGAKSAAVLEAIKLVNGAEITIDDIADATKLSKTTISQIVSREIKKGTIKSVDKGVYVYVKPKKAKSEPKPEATPTEEQATHAS